MKANPERSIDDPDEALAAAWHEPLVATVKVAEQLAHWASVVQAAQFPGHAPAAGKLC